MFTKNKTRNQHREAFTLIELLLVIAIIGILLTISIVTMFGLTDQATEEATVTTIQKVNRLIELRSESFDRAYPGVSINWKNAFVGHVAREVSTREGVPVLRVTALLSKFAADSPVWDILAKKAAFRFEFPQRVEELLAGAPLDNDLNSNGLPDNLEQKMYWNIASQHLSQFPAGTDGSFSLAGSPENVSDDDEPAERAKNLWTYKHDRKTESSELLYFFLFHAGNFGSAEISLDDFKATEIADTDGDGLPEFVDGWGEPLRFYRWPTRLIDPNAPLIFAPDFTTESDPTDLKTTLSVDRARSDIGIREVDVLERSVAEILIKGLPRKLQFTNAYITAACLNTIDRPGITDVSIIVPPDPLLRDPDDPAGLLYSLLETGIPVGDFSIDLSWEFNEGKYHTPDTFHAPLLMSAGKDGVLGLYEPFDQSNLGNVAMYNVDPDGDGTPFYSHPTVAQQQAELDEILDDLADSLTNRNRRAGGRR